MELIIGGIKVGLEGKKPNLNITPNKGDKFGIDAVVTYTDGKLEIFHNLTQLHLHYRDFVTGVHHDVALESNFHSTGYTRASFNISSIVVSKSPYLYDSI